MITYKEFIEQANILSEEGFNEVIATLPETDTDFSYADFSDTSTKNDLATILLSEILAKWNYVYPDEVNFDKLSMYLEDVNNLEDLKEIKETFSKWTISNYGELVDILKDRGPIKSMDRDELIDFISDRASLIQLRNFAHSL